MSQINECIGVAMIVTSLTVASKTFYKISPQVFLISAIAGVSLGLLQEMLMKEVKESNSSKAKRCLVVATVGSLASLFVFLDMKSQINGNMAFIQNNYCSGSGLLIGYSVVELVNYFF